jgi:arylsulfatase A-like enzyme
MQARGIEPDTYLRRAIDRYDGEIAQNDHSIEMLAGKMKDLGILDRSLVVVASDHGEEFLEHGFGAHGQSLYSELIHTVLLFWSPVLLPQSGRVAGPVQLVDIQPTILDLLGLKPPGGIEGRTLLPLMRAGQPGSTAPAMSTKLALPSATADSGVPEYLIYRPQAARAHMKEIELFDHRTDPGDRSDVAAQHPDVVARMKDELRNWMTQESAVKERVGKSGERTLDNATIQRLRSLGYLGGGASEKEH